MTIINRPIVNLSSSGDRIMSNERIMIVEDENFMARDLQMSLEQMGYTVDSMVPSGEQAIKEIREHSLQIHYI